MLKIIQKLFSEEVPKFFFGVVKKECNSHQYNILKSLLSGSCSGLYDISNNQLKCLYISGIRLLLNYNL